MKKLITIAAVSASLLCSCNGKSASAEAEQAVTTNDSTIIIYYSQTGTTKAVAEEFAKNLGCDIVAIEAVEPYDGDYDATIQRWRSEMDEDKKVAIKPVDVNLDDYKVVFLGFPIWGGTYASPMATFLADSSLAGKKIVPFATFGSGGIESGAANIAKVQHGAVVAEGYGVRNGFVERAAVEVPRFLIENGYIEGTVEPLPDFSTPTDVTDAAVSIFDAACGDYRFPLGTPVRFSSRFVDEGTEYCFEVRGANASDTDPLTTIYVIAPAGGKPFFTRVVRPLN